MKTTAPTLAPFLRSDAQGLMLADLFLDPSQEHSLTNMAAAASTAVPTVMREVDRLVESGFALDRRVGATRLVRANAEHPMFGAIRELVLYAYGPIAVLTALIPQIKGVKQAFIYGSWAARVQGKPGADPGDVDVLLVGDISTRAASELGIEATGIMGKEVHVHNLSEEAWNLAQLSFVKTVKSNPIIELKFD